MIQSLSVRNSVKNSRSFEALIDLIGHQSRQGVETSFLCLQREGKRGTILYVTGMGGETRQEKKAEYRKRLYAQEIPFLFFFF